MIRGARALGHNRLEMLTRLPAPIALVLAAALAASLAGLLALHQMIAAERADALVAIEHRRAAAVQMAGRELAVALEERAGGARQRIDAALSAPLRACAGCYRRQGGLQLLPRLGPAETTTGATRSIEAHYRELVSETSPGAPVDPDWSRRVRLHAACRGATGATARAAADAIVKDRAHVALPLDQDLASALALVGDCGLAPGDPLLAALLRTGLDVVGERHVEGLAPFFLRHLHDLGAADAAFARQRILAAAARAGVPAADFRARLDEVVPTALALPAHLDRPTLAPGPNPSGGAPALWYLEPAAGGAEGLLVDLAPILAA
ncbi:MAG TPA: hypothetical protein VKZ18_19155, partial [Polyangia bacterium]|nr:hypothetical protein [Polyangia bacterium]